MKPFERLFTLGTSFFPSGDIGRIMDTTDFNTIIRFFAPKLQCQIRICTVSSRSVLRDTLLKDTVPFLSTFAHKLTI